MEISQLSRNLDVMHAVESRFYPPVVSLGLVDDDGGSMMYGTGRSSDSECRSQGQSVAIQRNIVKIEPLETATADRHHCAEQDESGDLSDGAPGRNRGGNFVACRVCGDRASGYHYGVTSCEGCKGFFRRSMQKQMEYRCLRDGKCQVVRINRNRCQSCRFKKCVAAGMSRDSVRYGRVPKRSLSTEDQAVSSTHRPVDGQPSKANEAMASDSGHQMAVYDVIYSISHSHTAHCSETEDKVMAMEKTSVTLLRGPEISSDLLGRTDGLDLCRCVMFRNLAEIISPSVNKVVEFAKRVPDFQQLRQGDQLILIKSGFFEVWLMRMARLFNSSENSVLFSDGSVVPRMELELVFGPELIEAMFNFCGDFTFLGLNDTEIGLVTSILLSNPGCSLLSDALAVEELRNKLVEALQLQLARNHPAAPDLLAHVLARLPALSHLSTAHDQQLDWFRHRWSFLQIPPLFAEIYNIPRLDDIVDDDETEVQEEA